MTFLERIALKYQVLPTGHPYATRGDADPDTVARQYQERYLAGKPEKRIIEQLLRTRWADQRSAGWQPSRYPLTEEK